jgi:hypothetical protein
MSDNTVHSDPSFYKITVVTDETNVNVTQGITKVVQVNTPGPQGVAGTSGIGVETDPIFTAVSGTFILTSSFNSFTASYNTGSFSGSFIGNFLGTSSWAYSASQAISSSYAFSASYAASASYSLSSSFATSASYARSSSYANFAETASYAYQSSDIILQVLNQTGAPIDKGIVVRITGSNNASDTPRIGIADWTNDNLSANTIGLTITAIDNGALGYVLTEGLFKGYDTDIWTTGQLVFLGANGAITGSAPQAPLHAVRLGQVIRSQQNQGSIYIRIDNGYEVDELHDVKITNAVAGDLLTRSGSVWINTKQLSGSYGISGSLTMQGNIIPAGPYTNNTSSYSLGSPTAAWKDLYVSNGSVTFIDGASSASIKLDNGSVVFSGASVTLPTGSTTPTASYAVTASYALNGGGGVINTSSFATTGSNTFNGTQIITGSIILNSGSRITSLFQSNSIDIVAGPGGWAELVSNNTQSFVWVDDTGAFVITNYNNGNHQFEFRDDGYFVIPQVQSLTKQAGILSAGDIIIQADEAQSWRFSSGSGKLSAPGGIEALSFTGSLQGTSSWAQYATNATSAVTAQTASYLNTLSQNLTLSGSLTILNNLTVFGTQSVVYITSSQLDISTNLITVNTSTPAVRFGGIAVRDSGSLGTGLTGSLLWDSQNDVWIYSNPSGAAYDGGLVLMGPRNTSGMGSEVGISSGYAAIGNGSHHMTSSAIYSSGSLIRLENNTQVTGSLDVSGGITGSLFGTASWAVNAVTASTVIVNNDAAPTSRYILFVSDAAGFSSSTNRLLTNANLAYSPILNTIYATASNAITASYVDTAITASYVNTLNQDVTINGTLSVSGEIYGLQGQVTALASRNYLFSGF